MPRLRMAAPAVMLVMFASVLLFCAVQSTGLSSSMHKTTTSSKLAAAAAKLNAAVHLQAPGDTPLESASSSSSSSSSPSSSSESVSSVSSAAGIKIDFVVKDPAVTSAPAQITHADCDADLDDFIPDVPLTCALPGAKGLLEVNSTRTHAQARSESAVELKPIRNYHKIDQYQQYKRLGAGAFGEVWEYRMNGDPAKKAVVKFPLIQEHPPTPGQLADPDFQEKPSLQKQTEIMWTECEFATKIHARYPTNFLFMNCLQMQMDLQVRWACIYIR